MRDAVLLLLGSGGVLLSATATVLGVRRLRKRTGVASRNF
jgi:hypothetical protein